MSMHGELGDWRLSKHQTVIAIVILFLVLVAAALALARVYALQHHAAEASVKSTFSYACSGDKESLLCLSQQYKLKTEQKGVTAAFTDLKAAYQTDPAVKSDCHQLAHVIGREAADKAKTIGDAYSEGDNFCWSGYYHGVIESVVLKVGAKNLNSMVPTICAQLAAEKKYSFYHFNCVHGLGHGIMDVHKGDLMASLKVCDLLHDAWEQQSCYGGVFMQNEMDELDTDHGTPDFKADDPMYPCTAVENTYKEQCYLMQTSHALRVAGENFATVFSECAAVAAPYDLTCYQSLGRDASGNSNSTIGPTKQNCMLGQTAVAQQNCVVGAVKDFISYYHGDKQADELCKALDSSLQPVCQSTKVQYYSTF